MNYWPLFCFLLISSSRRVIGLDPYSVCHVCSCSEQIINCRNLNLNNTFDQNAWTNLSNYLEIYFGNNRIGHVTKMPALHQLVKLSYRNNRIVKIDDRAFKNLTSLKELDLSMNELTSSNLLPAVFEVRLFVINAV